MLVSILLPLSMLECMKEGSKKEEEITDTLDFDVGLHNTCWNVESIKFHVTSLCGWNSEKNCEIYGVK